MDSAPPTLIACPHCDLLLREVALPHHGTARCLRCGAILYRDTTDSLTRTLACTTAALIFFVIANSNPILGIEVHGSRSATNLYGAVVSLWQQKMHLISLLVCATTMLVPGLELLLMAYILVPLCLGIMPPGVPLLLRLFHGMVPWGMVEVFMLGILVSLVKLAGSASIVPGVALWSFGVLTLLLAAIAASFDPRLVWELLPKPGGQVAR